jgi:hypothetical protein
MPHHLRLTNSEYSVLKLLEPEITVFVNKDVAFIDYATLPVVPDPINGVTVRVAFTLLRKPSCPASLLPAVMLFFWFQTKISDLPDSVSDSPLI